MMLLNNIPIAVASAQTDSNGTGVPSASASIPSSGISASVDGTSGSLSLSVPITVPSYHGLEPKIQLAYNSNGGNSWVGVGWNLSASSVIQRGSKGNGMPKYDSDDVYYLNGQELIPDTTLGGTYSLKHKNYSKITFDNSNSKWQIWTQDGTNFTYTKLFETSKGVYRWALSTVTDTMGNTVTYSYSGDASSEYYLSKIAYNGTEISFYNETRSDVITSATGTGLASVNNRLKTIDIKTGNTRVRAYKLSYNTSEATSRSILSSIQQYGKNATLDSSNTITGGDSLPAISLATTTIKKEFPYYTSIANSLTSAQGLDSNDKYPIMSGDFNGDGKTDVGRIVSNGIKFYTSTGGGWSDFSSITGFSPAEGYTNNTKYWR